MCVWPDVGSGLGRQKCVRIQNSEGMRILDSYSRQLILNTRLEKGGKIIFVERSQKQCMRSEFWRK